jgi:hypothetical protein
VATTVRNIELMLSGSFGKEQLSNDGMQNLALGISGAAVIPLTNVDHTLTTDNQGEAQHFIQILTGALTANVNVIVPAESRVYVADNRTSGAFTVTVKTAAGGGVAVDQGARTLVYCDGTTVYPVASGTGGGGGGSGAPTDATYLVQSAHALLTGERVVTNTATVVWDFATPGAAGATIPDGAISYAKIQDVASKRILGRFTPTSGDTQEITLGTGLTLDDAGTLTASSAGSQPLDATLTALAGQATGPNQLPYFTGTDTADQTPLTPFARTLLDDVDQAAMRTTLGLTPGTDVQPLDATLTALAGVTTGANTLPFFTGTDTASTTTLTAFMRSLLDDPDQATAQATLGVTGAGGYTDEQAQDAVGTILTDSATLDFTYDDTTPSITGIVKDTSITVAKMQQVATRTLLGRGSAGTGAVEPVLASGAGLVFSGPTLTLDAGLEAIAALNPAANTLPYFTGALTAALTPFTAAGRALLDDADNAAQRTTLGLGTMAEQNANAVAITGGSALNLSVASVGYAPQGGFDCTTNRLFAAGVSSFNSPVGYGPGYLAPDANFRVSIDVNKAGMNGIILRHTANDTGGSQPVYFANLVGTVIGSISTNASATAFNTSSDIRLKHAIAPLTAALDRIRALNPISHLWNADDSYGEGFLAHELMQHIPLAVTGQPDEVNPDGSIKPQQVDHSKLVPWLTSAVQALLARVETLEAQVAALQA